MKAWRAIALTACFLGILAGTAGASPIKWVSVDLGTHRFGHLRTPNSVVNVAPPRLGSSGTASAMAMPT